MPDLVLRDVSAEMILALERRAVARGRSAEAEHKAILRAALLFSSDSSFVELLQAMPNVGNDEDFERRR